MSEEGKEQEVVDKPFETEEEFETEKLKVLEGLKGEPGEEKDEVQEDDEESSDKEDDETKSEGPAVKESKRLRQLNRELKEELEELRSKVDALSRQPEKTEEKVDKLKAASLDELIEAEEALDDHIFNARQEGDSDRVAQLRAAKKKVRAEMLSRPAKDISSKSKKETAASQFSKIVGLVQKSYPELGDKSSSLHKKAQEYYNGNPELMEQLGEIGSYFAVLASLADRPAKGKEEVKEKKNVVKEMETIIENSTSRTPNTASKGNSKALSVATLSDKEFEDVYNKVKMKELDLAQLGR